MFGHHVSLPDCLPLRLWTLIIVNIIGHLAISNVVVALEARKRKIRAVRPVSERILSALTATAPVGSEDCKGYLTVKYLKTKTFLDFGAAAAHLSGMPIPGLSGSFGALLALSQTGRHMLDGQLRQTIDRR